jgi:hypothetical protein
VRDGRSRGPKDAGSCLFAASDVFEAEDAGLLTGWAS